MNQDTLIVITGPTGVGKTATAIEVARRLGAEIISADSRQIFREIPIGTAAPTDDEMRQLCGYLLLARLFMKGMTPNERSANEFIDQARTALHASAPVRRAAVSALQKYQELGEEAFRAGEKVLEEAGL